MNMKTPLTDQAIALEKEYGSFNYAPLPIVLNRGEGVYLWDVDGNKYLDFMSGFSAVSQGHCHPRIVKAVQEQVAQLTLVSRALYSDQMGPFARYATQLFGFQRILMMNTGAEAFETVSKIARKWGYEKKKIPTGFAKILTCRDNFHGRTLGAVSAASNKAHHLAFGPILEGYANLSFGDLDALVQALEDPNVAAFIVEPIQGEAGVNVPPEGYLRKAFELCQAKNVLFIADEIQTGIARTGKLLACHHEGFRPDVVLLGKALSGGTFPVSAVLADEPVLDVLQPGDHGSTFGGSPLACHVAHESLRVVMDEKLSENAAEMGEIFRQGVRDLKSPWVQEVRGKGLLNAVVFDFPDTAKKAGDQLCLAFRDAGLIAKTTRPNVIRFAPPLVITQAQMKDGLKIIGEVLSQFTL